MTCFVRYLICRQKTENLLIDKGQFISCRSARGSINDPFQLQCARFLSDLLTFIFTKGSLSKNQTTDPSVPLEQADNQILLFKTNITQFKLPVAQTSFSRRHNLLFFQVSRPRIESSSGGIKIVLNQLSGVHWETGGPNISMVSRTSDRWSRNEFTDTLRIRASSALHLLKHTKKKLDMTSTAWPSDEGWGGAKQRFLTQTACSRTPTDVCWCRLSSARGPATESAERRRPHGTTGRERPESCRRVKEDRRSSRVSDRHNIYNILNWIIQTVKS